MSSLYGEQQRAAKGQFDSRSRRHAATRNRDALRGAWIAERAAARTSRACRDAVSEWHHLERAHILSQPMAAAHVRTHLAMLTYGIRAHDRREVLGQIFRLALAGPGSWSGRYPVGNTGGAAISAITPLPIPDDLGAPLRGGS
jgi:Protein of unknown function (DUF3703)